jgi:hypothetical protein
MLQMSPRRLAAGVRTDADELLAHSAPSMTITEAGPRLYGKAEIDP